MLTKIDIVWFWLISFATVHAAELPTDPILRIETGMHTAPIRSLSVDTTERFLLTAAEDKTLRLWELATGNLLKIYRPPIGTGADEGIIYAGVLSPDGEWVAGSGWTGVEWDGKVSIYLFNRATGKLVKRLTGLEQIIFHLCFSPDGQYLAATLGGGWGVRVWETHTWQRVLNDAGYADSSYSCDFDAQNRLVTSAWDGFIRLYALVEGQFTLVARNTAPGGKQPATVAFNPVGDQLAVGFDDSTQVNVLSGQDLTFRYAPDTTGVDNGTLSRVAWSQGSNRLYAGGSYSNQPGILPILHWPQVGQGSHYTLWPVSSNAIFDIHALKNGYMVYGTANPSFAVLDNTGNKVIEQVADIADYRDNLNEFKLSADGSTLQFGFEQWGERLARFSLTDQRLLLNPLPDTLLQPPDTTSLNIVNWLHADTPTLNDIPLKLEPYYEVSHSLAIAPDKSQFLLGTDWSLYLFDAQGQQQWRASVPSIAWGVNISGDGQKGVAALGDGTIRWYNLATGQELLAFFPHKDRQRWIVWTPSGYYMSSGENANNFIGWHINQGKDQTADFWPISVLSATYQRPDIVKRVLITLDESEAIRQVKLETGESLAPPEKLATALKKKTEYLLELNPSGLGKAVIVAASGEQGTNSLFPYTNAATTEMYRLLRQRGLTDGDIVYLNPLPPIVPADGYVDAGRQDFPMRDPLVELTQAITQAKNDLQPGQQFIFYLHGHAKPNVLELKLKPEPGIDISADQLKTLLAQIPPEVQQIIILDTCYSGSFFDELTGVPNRILISSADADSKAFSPQAGSFAEYFIKHLLQETGNLGEAFDDANSKILEQHDIFSTQRPQLDDTQDGQFDDRDGQVAHRTYLGKQKLHGALPPEITVTHPPIHLATGQTTATLWVKVVPDFNGIKQVRALLVNEQDQPPEYQGESTLFSRRELILQPNYELQRYETHYDQFHTATRWKIFYQAQSNEGDWSEVRVGYVVQGESPIVTQVKPHLNKTRYHPGDTIRFTVQITGEVLIDVYVGVVFPDGAFQTIAYPLNFSLVSTLHPYQTQLQLTGEQNLPIFNLPLPAIPSGRYQVCGLLTKPQSDPLNQENWLDFNCEEFEFSG